MKKKIISVISIILLLGVAIGFLLYKKNGQSPFIFAKVSKGTVFQRVSETGEVEVPKEKKLGFKVSGKIAKIFVKEGEEVKKGQKLAELENKDLFLQLEEAKAVLDLKQANYEKLITGAKKEEIKVKEANVLEAQTEFEKAQQNLKDVLAENQQKLDTVYKKALCILDEAHLAIYNSYNTVVELQSDYFPPSNGYSMQVIEEKDKIKNNLKRGGKLIEKAKNSESYQDIDKALSQLKKYLQDTNLSLTTVRDIVNNNIYRDMVSDTYKSSLDERKTSVVGTFRKVVDVIQEISNTKTENKSKENNAKAEVSRTKARLEKAKDELSLIKSKARKEDIDSALAEIRKAKANISLIESKIEDTIIKSEEEGVISEVLKEEGEIVSPGEKVFTFIPTAPYQIKVDIYEEDIVKVKPGQEVEISLTAFPNSPLKGKVSSISPAEKIIDGVVYYEVTIEFIEKREGIKPGMTADIIINTAKKENVLIVPKEAVEEIDSKKIVQVKKGDKILKQEIKTGLEGEDYYEVISGLKEGDEVVIGVKES